MKLVIEVELKVPCDGAASTSEMQGLLLDSLCENICNLITGPEANGLPASVDHPDYPVQMTVPVTKVEVYEAVERKHIWGCTVTDTKRSSL